MLPPTLNQSSVLPSALVAYSHQLMGDAIKSSLVRLGLEVVLSPLASNVFLQETTAYEYIFLVFSGQEDFAEQKPLINEVLQKLCSRTKLSMVISVAQSGIHQDNQQDTYKPQEFDFDNIATTFEALHRSVATDSLKTQLVLVEDVVDFSRSDSILNPTQALLSHLDSNRITLIGSPEQEYYPLSSTQAAEVIVRELFVLRQKQQIIGVRGRKAIALISLANEVKHALSEKGVDVQITSLFPKHRFGSSAGTLSRTNPPSKFNLTDCLKSTSVQTTSVSRIQVPQVKELPIVLESPNNFGTAPLPVVQPTPQPVFFSGDQSHKKIVANPKKITSTKPLLVSTKPVSFKRKQTSKTGLFVGLGAFSILCTLLAWMVSPFMQYALSSNNLLKSASEDNVNPRLLASLLRAQDNITAYLSFASQVTPDKIDAELFAINQSFKQSTNKLIVQTHLKILNGKLSELVSKQLNLSDGDVYQSAIELAQLAQQNYQDLTTLELGSKETSQATLSTQEPEFSFDKIKSLKSSLKKMQLGLESLPYLLPANQSTNVLVLIQNSHELRATGGFIESVGLLRFNSAKLLSSEFKSSYELDELLKGKVDPPEDLRRFLGENQWYGRDANWDPDFVNSAKNIAWFYEKQTNSPIDLVVALTIPALSDLLDSVNGVVLVDGTLLDGSNLSSWLTESQKKQLGDQSTQPLIIPFVELMLKKIQTLNQVDLYAVAHALGASLEKSETLVAGLKPETNTSLNSLGWAGSVLSPVCPAVLSQAQCVVDTLYINESNVGVNSANAQVSRTQTHTIAFRGDKIIHTHQLNFIHSGQNESWPGGVYQNYLRMYLPQTAGVLAISQDGVKIGDADIVQTQAQDKNVVGFLVRVPPNSSSQIVIEYDEINQITTQNALTYVFLMQKQPGITQAPLSLVLDYPPGYSLKRVSHPYALSDNHLMVNDSLAKHFFLAVELNP